MELSQVAADLQAKQDRCGHPGWVEDRFYAVLGLGLGKQADEIAAMSWPDRSDGPLSDIGDQMFEAWRQSSGHWRTASRVHAWFGAGMARSVRGTWYAAIITVD